MKYILMMCITLVFLGCGDMQATTTKQPNSNDIEEPESTEQNRSIERAVNIYIHGYNQEGEKQTDTYGKSESDKVLKI